MNVNILLDWEEFYFQRWHYRGVEEILGGWVFEDKSAFEWKGFQWGWWLFIKCPWNQILLKFFLIQMKEIIKQLFWSYKENPIFKTNLLKMH